VFLPWLRGIRPERIQNRYHGFPIVLRNFPGRRGYVPHFEHSRLNPGLGLLRAEACGRPSPANAPGSCHPALPQMADVLRHGQSPSAIWSLPRARPNGRGLVRASVRGHLPPAGRDRAPAEKGLLAEDGAGGTTVVRMILPRSRIPSQRNGGGHDHFAVAGAFRQSGGEEGVGDAVRRRQAARVFTRERRGRAAECGRSRGRASWRARGFW
jgi:hypothetical protein